MSIEPTPEEAGSLSVVRDVANWASVGRRVETDDGVTSAEQDPVRVSLLALFGLREDDHIRVLAGILESDFLGALRVEDPKRGRLARAGVRCSSKSTSPAARSP